MTTFESSFSRSRRKIDRCCHAEHTFRAETGISERNRAFELSVLALDLFRTATVTMDKSASFFQGNNAVGMRAEKMIKLKIAQVRKIFLPS